VIVSPWFEAVLGKSFAAGRALIAQVAAQSMIQLRTGTLVWGVFDNGVLEIERDNQCERLVSQRLIVATGACERPIPFPGWTLPGVTTAGAAQTLLKAQFVLPGSRILMSGTGPFQLPVSTQLLKAGAEIIEILEALPARDYFRRFPQPWRHLDKLREAQGYFATLLSHRVPSHFGQAVVEARGDGRVEEAVVARLDEAGRPLTEGRRTVSADAVLVNYGFIPSLQMPRLLGCDTGWDEAGGCWVVACDADQRSSAHSVVCAPTALIWAPGRKAMEAATGLSDVVASAMISACATAESALVATRMGAPWRSVMLARKSSAFAASVS
jgi:thioredoxin reductase